MAETLHALLRFARVVRYRIIYIVVAVAVSGLLGALYYTTSTRLYEARASLMVIPNGADLWNPATAVDGSRQALIPTYVHLFQEDVVLDRAAELLASDPAAQAEFRDVPVDKWADVIRKQLSAERERRTNLIVLAYRARSADAAEAVISAIDRAYLDFIDKNHRDVSSELVRMLEIERSDIEKRLNAKQHDLLQIKRQCGDLGLPDATQAVHPVIQRVLSVNQELIAVQQKQVELRATLSAVENAAKSGGDLRQHLVSVEPIVGRELLLSALGLNPQSAEALSHVEQKLIDDRARLEKLLKHYGPAHPDVVQAQQVIVEGERYLSDHQRNVQNRLNRMTATQLGPILVNMLQQKLQKLDAQEQELARRYQLVESQAVELNDRTAQVSIVENEVERLRHLHDTLLNRITGIDVNQSQADVRVTVVSDPVAGTSPVYPRLLITIALCVAAGLAVGISIVYVIDLLDDRFRSPDEITQQTDLAVLAIVRTLPPTDGTGLESVCLYARPDFAESEAFRTLRTTITFSQREIDCLAVTSAQPGDGKTTILANLGVAYARAGKRTLLIDADLRRPGLSRLLQVRGIDGLSQVLHAAAPVSELASQSVRPTLLPRLDVLPCGSRPSDPVELLSSPRLAELLEWAAGQYEQVLIDCPPVMAASDAAIIGRRSDGMMLVLQPEKNHRRLVLRAVANLRTIKVPLIGVAANRVGQLSGNAFLTHDYAYETYDYTADEEDEPAVVTLRRAA